MQQHKRNDRTETVVAQLLDHKDSWLLPLTSDLGSRTSLSQYALRRGVDCFLICCINASKTCQVFVQDRHLTRGIEIARILVDADLLPDQRRGQTHRDPAGHAARLGAPLPDRHAKTGCTRTRLL